MKQKLLNKLWLRVGMIVAIMTTALSGTVWAETYTMSMDSGTKNGTKDVHWTANNATLTHSNVSWSASFSGGSITNSNNYVQIGSKNNPFTTITLSTSGISGTITEVKVGCGAYNSNATVAVTVGGNAFGGNAQSVGAAPSTSGPCAQNTFSGSASGAIVITITNGNSGRAGYIDYVSVTYTSGGSSSTPSLSVNPTSIAFGEKTINDSYQETFDVTFANLTENLTVSGFTGVTVSPTTISKDATSPATVTVTYAPTAEGNISGNVTVSNTADAMSQTVAVTGSAYDPSNLTYYEKVTSAPSDWTGDYIFTGINSGNYYALTGVSNNLGTTAQVTVTEDGIASTSTTDAYKVTVAETTNGYSLYMDGVGYLSYSGSNNQLHASDEFEESTCEWTISFASGVATITNVAVAGRMLQFNYNSGNPRFACYTSSQVKLTLFKLNDGTPSISADDVEIAYNETSGSITYSLTNEVTGGVVTAASSESWLTVGTPSDGTIALTCDANTETTARTATVTLTYTYNSSETVTKTVTVTQAAAPVIYTTIPAIFNAATSTETSVYVTFNNWVVSGVSTNGKNVFVTDNAGNGFVIYSSSDQSSTYAVGNILSGTAVTCGLKKYNGFAELLNVDASDLTITTGGTVTAANVAMADLAGVNTGALVSYENLTCSVDNSKYYLTDGTTTLQVFNSLYAFDELEDGKTYNITGIYEQFNSTKEILPRSAADIEEYVAPKHTVTFFVNGVEQTDDEAEVSEGAAITFPATPADVNGKTFMGWTTEEISGTTDTAPTIVTSATMGNADVTYYAVFATSTSGGASDTYSLVSDVNDLSDGDNIILVSTGSYTASGQTHYFTVANGNVNSSSLMDPVDVTITDDQVTSTDVAPITLKEVTGGWKLQMGTEYINIVSTKNQITLDENGAVNTISITSGDATIGTADGSDTRNIYYNPNSGNGRFAYYKSAQKPVSIYKQEGGVTYSGYCTTVAPATESVTVTDAGYATYCSENALDFTNTDIKAYVGTKKGDKLTFTPINQVPANTGMLLVYASGKTENVPVIASATPVENNCLVGVNEETTINSTDYILNKVNDGVGFYKAGSYTTLGAHKAYIPAAVGNGVKGFTIDFDDDATGISLMEDGRSQMEDGVIYNLAGQRISKMQKGINIVNGKKIMVK